MKHLSIPLALLGVLAILCCSKSKNTYTVTDHTVGMLNSRHWQGKAYGNVKGDTVIEGNHTDWPKHYDRNVDTDFSIDKINGFVVNANSAILVFRTVDSAAEFVNYDSVYASSAKSFLVWDFGHDTMHLEFHQITGSNAAAGTYYESNWVLHTP